MAEAELGFVRVISDEAAEEGGVLKSHLYVKGKVEPHRVLSRRVTLSNLCFRRPTLA